MRDLSALLREHVVTPLNQMGIPIDLRGVQALLILVPVLIVGVAFGRAWWKKQQAMRDIE